jgi:hypothetical protein
MPHWLRPKPLPKSASGDLQTTLRRSIGKIIQNRVKSQRKCRSGAAWVTIADYPSLHSTDK